MSLFGSRELYLDLRRKVVPYLRTFPSVNVWLPACAAGQEVYATAIVLREEGLFERATLYATEQSEALLQQARDGTYALESIVASAGAYLDAGGRARLEEYYWPDGDRAVMRPLLRERITFAQHSLISDASFNEFQLVICPPGKISVRSRWPKERAFQIIHQSLCRFGLLAFGSGEEAQQSRLHRTLYERFAGRDAVLRKME